MKTLRDPRAEPLVLTTEAKRKEQSEGGAAATQSNRPAKTALERSEKVVEAARIGTRSLIGYKSNSQRRAIPFVMIFNFEDFLSGRGTHREVRQKRSCGAVAEV